MSEELVEYFNKQPRLGTLSTADVTFEIQEIRPLADFGQGWEKSI